MRFALVGSVGFAVDLCVCKLLLGCGVPPLLGRVPAMLLGLAATFLLNRGVTAPVHGSLRDQALRYGVANATVAALNYTVFAVALLGTHGLLPMAALSVGSGAGFAVSVLDVKHRARVAAAAANDDRRGGARSAG